jgi:prohibitin 2
VHGKLEETRMDDINISLVGKIKIAIVLLILFGLLMLFFGPVYTVDAGERAVLLTWGSVSSEAIGPGLHFKMPFIQSIAKFSVQTQKYSADATAASKDLQTVHTSIAVIYHLEPSKVPEIYTELGNDYGDRVIQPTVQEVVKASTAKFGADQLITNRSAVADQIQDMLKTKLANYGIYVESTAITNFNFSQSFNEAIEAKVTAVQQKQKAEMDLQRIRVEAEQKVTTAKAEAEALRVQREVVSPELIELRKIEVQRAAIEKWDGKMPVYAGGNAMPLIGISS